MMAAVSSSYCCNLGKKFNSNLKKEQRFGDSNTGNLQLKNHPKLFLEGLRTSNIIAKSSIASKILKTLYCFFQRLCVEESYSWLILFFFSFEGEVRKINSYESRNLDITHGNLTMGELLNDGLVYQRHFLVKSYESGPDKKMTMFFIINQLHVWV